MRKIFKKTSCFIIAVCLLILSLSSCTAGNERHNSGDETLSEQPDNRDETNAIDDDNKSETEDTPEAESEPQLTDELPNSFDEEDIRNEIIDKLLYDSENHDPFFIFSKSYEVTVTKAQGYVNDFRVIAEGTIHGENEFREYNFGFEAEFQRFSHNNRWGIDTYKLTYLDDASTKFDIADAEIQIEQHENSDVDITSYTENEDGSYTVNYDYICSDMYAPVGYQISNNTAKYMPFPHCTNVWYIDSCQRGVGSYPYVDAIHGDYSLTDGNVTLNFTLPENAVEKYIADHYYSLNYTIILGDGTVLDGYSTLSIPLSHSYDQENQGNYVEIWHTFVLDIGDKTGEFCFRAYESKSELSGWYLDGVKLAEN